ncbi:MAG: hypothetical protein ACI9N1_001950 [Flavobacteriales bacterium]
MDWVLSIAFLSLLISILTLIYGIICSKYFSTELKYLLLLIFISVVSDVISYFFSVNRLNNSLVVNLYSIIEVLLYLKIYSVNFKSGKFKIFPIVVLFVLSTIIGVELFKGQLIALPSVALMINSSISIMLLSILWFYRIFKNSEFSNLLKEPFFWINSSSLVYFSSSFFIFLFSNYLSSINAVSLWVLHNTLHIIYFVIIIIGFWKQRLHQK